MDIRAATHRDLDFLAEQRLAMFGDMGDRYSGHLDELAAAQKPWMEKHFADGSLAGFIAEEDGVAVGGVQIAFVDVPPSRVDRSGRSAYLFGLRVVPQHRRRGIARALLQAAIGAARDAGVRLVTLQASEDGRPVYERLGFETTREMALLLDGERIDGDTPSCGPA
jgi:ribosomal protein S18 acetylase RimI-like enzyme